MNKDKIEKLIERIDVFEDTDEILEGLAQTYTNGRDYWVAEASTHIEGLWDLVNAFKEALDDE